jgi:hypothetical protein
MVLAVCVPAVSPVSAQALTVEHVWHVNLDGDRHVEQVRIVSHTVSGMPWFWLQVVDRVHGRRVLARVSPSVENLQPSLVRITDMNGLPTRNEIFYVGFVATTGGPVYAGIRNWSGSRKHRLWSYRPPEEYRRRIHRGVRYGTLPNIVRVIRPSPKGDATWEVKVAQGEMHRSGPVCCPQATLTLVYRYAPAARRWVVYAHRWHRSRY